MNERPHPAGPICAERAWRVARHTADNQNRTIVQDVANPDVDTRVNVIFIYEDTLSNVLSDIIRDNLIRASEPAERTPPRQLLARLLLCEADDLLNCAFHK
jgi:hypothetical protein